MECLKCKGLMMLEWFSDFFLIFYAWKCANCGAIIDRTISNNRRKRGRSRSVNSRNPLGAGDLRFPYAEVDCLDRHGRSALT
jgi:hypothetical protein